MADDKTEQALEACQDAVEELKVQNEELREAAGTFGELAERLNRALHHERGPHPALADSGAPDSRAPECPRCAKERYTHLIPQTDRGDLFHCDYCGNSWH